jgi:hypothetical protein
MSAEFSEQENHSTWQLGTLEIERCRLMSELAVSRDQIDDHLALLHTFETLKGLRELYRDLPSFNAIATGSSVAGMLARGKVERHLTSTFTEHGVLSLEALGRRLVAMRDSWLSLRRAYLSAARLDHAEHTAIVADRLEKLRIGIALTMSRQAYDLAESHAGVQ